MSSSNRHWPSMFKSKPCNNQAWSQPHENNSSLLSSSARSSSNSPFSSGCEERTPEPKPRWNPKPEQIRILEAIFNSGMVNPPRDEIRRIRAQLQEYGQVGDANVFYWFQNRKSRSKHKQRTLQAKTTASAAASHHSPPQPLQTSSSSSSDKNSPKKFRSSSYGGGSSSNNSNSTGGNNMIGSDQFIGNSPTSVNQCHNYFQQLVAPHHTNATTHEFVPHEPVFFPLQQSGASVMGNFSQGLCFNTCDSGSTHHHSSMGTDSIHIQPTADHAVGGFSTLLFGDMLSGDGGVGDAHSSKRDDLEKFKFQQELSFLVSNPLNTSCAVSSTSPVVSTTSSSAISSSLGQILGVGEAGGIGGKSTVSINGMAIEVPNGPLNIKEEFGENAILVNSSTGHPVLTNEWGVTLHPLQHGASYFLMSSLVASPLLDKLDSTPDLLAPGYPYQI